MFHLVWAAAACPGYGCDPGRFYNLLVVGAGAGDLAEVE